MDPKFLLGIYLGTAVMGVVGVVLLVLVLWARRHDRKRGISAVNPYLCEDCGAYIGPGPTLGAHNAGCVSAPSV